MTASPALIVERDGAITTLILNRPDVGNALDIPLARALLEQVIACDEDEAVRAVVLTGSGRLFCAGGDLASFSATGTNISATIKEITAYLHAVVARLTTMDKPLVTAINGPAAGAGLSFAIAGDVALADPAAHFTSAYTAVGLTPDCGATWLLPRLVGMRRAQELVLTNRRVGAEEAATIGLVSRVTAAGAVLEEARTVARGLAAGATGAFGAARRLLRTSLESSLETQLDLESRTIATAARTPHGREGIAAFLGKRKPDFSR